VSTSTLGGHVNTIPEHLAAGRHRRRCHSDAFKADAVAACMQPGMSMAAVALSHGVNANLLRRWVRMAEMTAPADAASKRSAVLAASTPPPFVALRLPSSDAAASGIRIELRRGAVSMSVTWPSDAAAECAAWVRELLR